MMTTRDGALIRKGLPIYVIMTKRKGGETVYGIFRLRVNKKFTEENGLEGFEIHYPQDWLRKEWRIVTLKHTKDAGHGAVFAKADAAAKTVARLQSGRQKEQWA